ncbi:MAG: transposase [Tepidisphaeraceae bacterium]
MSQPLVIAHHIMWTCYGWWLPNDLRGSTSNVIRNDLLRELGELHFGRKQVQPAGRDIRAFYSKAVGLLQHELLQFTQMQFETVANAFAEAIERHAYTCYACVVMPDHVHLLLRKHKHLAEDMIEHLKDESVDAIRRAGVRPSDHPVWTQGLGWKVFLDHPDEVRRTISYIERNPDSWRLPRQKYDWVKPYDGWPLHPGHSPNSPYVKALRAAGRYPR